MAVPTCMEEQKSANPQRVSRREARGWLVKPLILTLMSFLFMERLMVDTSIDLSTAL